jgi:hypothetical protein
MDGDLNGYRFAQAAISQENISRSGNIADFVHAHVVPNSG